MGERGRRALLAFVAVLALAPPAAAQTVTWQTRWAVDDRVRYDVVQERVDERSGVAPARRVVESTLVVRVLEGRRLGWHRTPKDLAPLLSGVGPEGAAALSALLRETPEVVFRTDDDGIPEAIENLDALTAVAQRVSAEVLRHTAQAPGAPDAAAAVREMVSPALVQSQSLSEGNTLLGYAGVSFDSDRVIEVPQQLPNPLGGPAFAAVTRVRALSHDAQTKTLRIEARTSLDPESARQTLAQTLEQMGRRLGRPMPPDAIRRVQIAILHTIDVNLVDGWPSHATTRRDIDIEASDGVARRSDAQTYVRLP